jgi:hypothetical protein
MTSYTIYTGYEKHQFNLCLELLDAITVGLILIQKIIAIPSKMANSTPVRPNTHMLITARFIWTFRKL